MKKILSLGLILIFTIALLTACGGAGDSKDKGTGTVTYKDGTYTAEESDFDDHGWKGQIEIKVEGGKITEVNYDEVNQEGNKKSEDTGYIDNFKQQKNINLPDVYDTLEKGLVEKQNPDAVDTYTGATGTTQKFKTLAKEALKGAQGQ